MSHAVSDKAYKGMGMEGLTAKWYASLTQKTIDEFRILAHRVADDLPSSGSDVLDLAPGPGYFAIELARLANYSVTGLDISRTFVAIAQRNAELAGVDVDFRLGDAANMPFDDGSFDFLLCRAAFKNFSQPVRALQEMYRVLKPGGRALIIDLKKDASKDTVSEAVESMHLGAVNTWMTKLTFRFMLLKRAYTREQFEEFLAETKFESIIVDESLLGLELSLQRLA